MKKKFIAIITSATLTIICSEIFIIKNKQKSEENSDNIFLRVNNKYDVTKETQKSFSNIDENKRSEIIKDINTSQGVVALSFENIEDMDTLQKILNMLDEYNIKATFIISGKEAAENSEMIQSIKKHGHEIGAAVFVNQDINGLSEEEIIRNLCKAKKIVESITNDEIDIIKCKPENYTNDFLSYSYACGLKYTVESHNYINYQSFKNYQQAFGYIKKLKNGSVISVKVNGVLDESEYTGSKKQENDLSIDKQPELNEVSSKKEINILDTIEWLLQAISLNDKTNVKLSRLPEFDGMFINEQPYKQKKYEIQYLNNYIYYDGKNNIKAIDLNNENIYAHKNQKQQKNELYERDFSDIINKNNGALSNEVKMFYTTQEAVAYTFRGISNEESLNNVLETLKNMNLSATFFVTKDEIEKYPERIKKIVAYGNEIGNGGITNSSKILDKSVSGICSEIYTVNEMLKKIGIETSAYMPGYGYVNDNIKEAVSSIKNINGYENYQLFTYTKAPVISRYKNSTAENIIKDYFDTNIYLNLQKGEIVYFRIDSELFDDSATISSLVSGITENYVYNGYIHRFNSETKSYELMQKPLGYSVALLGELQNTYKINYGNNVTTNSSVNVVTTDAGNKNKVLKERTTAAAEAMYSDNYIGNDCVDLIGFTEDMKSKIDKSGVVDTGNESVIFFTFDDWGSDVIVNEILDVLNKHNVKGTFFAISKYVDVNSGISNANPNLLRTIALNGNDIGSHTYNHETSDTDKAQFKESVKKSYYSLDSVVGDTGTLKPILRFPTLMTTKDGLDAVFESGFDYCISGNISTHDYEASSANEIVDTIAEQLIPNKGNIIVMHMNNQAYYTPEALDIFLTNNENGVYGKKYKILKLGDYFN